MYTIIGQVQKRTVLVSVLHCSYSFSSIKNSVIYYEVTYSGFFDKIEKVFEMYLKELLEVKKVKDLSVDVKKMNSSSLTKEVCVKS